jgi:electron transfer flavoprotein alpha subunit
LEWEQFALTGRMMLQLAQQQKNKVAVVVVAQKKREPAKIKRLALAGRLVLPLTQEQKENCQQEPWIHLPGTAEPQGQCRGIRGTCSLEWGHYALTGRMVLQLAQQQKHKVVVVMAQKKKEPVKIKRFALAGRLLLLLTQAQKKNVVVVVAAVAQKKKEPVKIKALGGQLVPWTAVPAAQMGVAQKTRHRVLLLPAEYVHSTGSTSSPPLPTILLGLGIERMCANVESVALSREQFVREYPVPTCTDP